jgi:hypothetical protein
MRPLQRFLLVTAALLAGGGVAGASGAAFKISGVGADLGRPDDEGAEVPKFRAKLKVGQTVTLVAEGVVLPRGGAAAPGEIDAGAWLFDDEAFKLVPPEKARPDKTRAVVALAALRPGTTRVRFVGEILGRYRKYDVIVEVAAK